MMESFTVYINNTGEIVRSGYGDIDIQVSDDGESVVSGESDGSTHYINNGVITNKPTNTTTIDKATCLADGIDFITLSSIPDNATILISGQGVNINQSIGNSDTITFDLAGEYNLRIESFPSLDYEVIINAN